ncbi:MAG: ATP-dependent zinc metalloprotease FtsH [Candidatus Coatesbacteria bacterium]
MPGRRPPFRRAWRGDLVGFTLIALVLMTVYSFYARTQRAGTREIKYSELLAAVSAGRVREVSVVQKELTTVREVQGKYKDGTPFFAYAPEDPRLFELLSKGGVEVTTKPAEQSFWSVLGSVGYIVVPIILIIYFFTVMRQMQGAGSGAMAFGKSRAKLFGTNAPKVTFADVAGVDEAKEELREIIDFLKDPMKFQRLGGRIPKGVLLLGPPGTGKTLLARAVAGEAGVPFFSISGSDFVEMFVGVGAARVRDLFEQGKKNAPCIIFVDEIDAVGRHRGAGLGGGHDEREQTLNALLVEMDGFDANRGVIIMAATNRPDVLDPALLRPGRFDRHVIVDNPDIVGREGILKVHTRTIPMGADVDLKKLARGTPGFSGADLANLVNEAALLAARRNKKFVEMTDLDEAKDRVMMGPARTSRVISEREKKVTAYHEGGHALVSWLLPGSDPIHKVTIIPRGHSLGLTASLPTEDRYNRSQKEFMNDIAMLLGGRAAEELMLKDFTTGAASDLERATTLAHRMVCEFGMSRSLGPRTFGRKDREIFLGRDFMRERNYSEETAERIDQEIQSIIRLSYARALGLLRKNRDRLVRLAEKLLEKEVLDGEEVTVLLKGVATGGSAVPAAARTAGSRSGTGAAARSSSKPA